MATLIHIGFHKTGTTWFQKNFYPKVEGANYIDRRSYLSYLCNSNALKIDPVDFRKLIEPHDDRTNILCLEEISGNFNNGGYNGYFSKGMADFFHAYDPRAKVVIFIRNQVDIIASCYQQYIKEGGTYSPNRYLFNQLDKYKYRAPVFMMDHFKYSALIEYYRKLFGDNLHVYLYEDFREDPARFCRKFSQDLHLETSAEIDYHAKNPSIGRLMLKTHRFLNNFTTGDVAHKRVIFDLGGIKFIGDRKMRLKWLRRFFGSMGDSKIVPEKILERSAMKTINDFYSEDNRRLEEIHNLGVASYNYV